VNCLDCTMNERPPAPAVGVCVSCGAAVCARCARLAEHPVPQPSTVGNPLRRRARAVSCVSCDAALDHRHGTAVAAAVS
jgi:hypothetical protein